MRQLLFFALIFASLHLHATTSATGPLFVYEGILSDTAGSPVDTPQSITLQILYSGTCLLYEEKHASITPGSNGEFSLIVGMGDRLDVTGNTGDRIFASSGVVQCGGNSPSTMTVSSSGLRTLRVKLGSTILSPDVEITQVPFAANAQRLADKQASDFLQTTPQLTQSRMEEFISVITAASGNAIQWNGTSFTAFNPNDGSKITSGSIAETAIQSLPYSKLTSVPASLVAIGGLSCDDGKILKKISGAWACGDESGLPTESDPSVQSFAKNAPGSGLTVAGNQLQVSYGTSASTAAQGNDTRITGAFQTTTTLEGDLNGTLPNPTVAKIQNNAVSIGTLSAVDSGKVYRWGGSSFSASFLNFGDLRNAAGTPQLGTICAPNEKIQWSVITDAFSCQPIGSLNASAITTGTLNSARLPAASESSDGIVNQLVQNFKGVKTFIDNVVMQGSLSVSGSVSADRIQVTNSSAPCNASNEGSIRFNSVTKKFEGCIGSSWTQVSIGTVTNITLGAPSISLVKSGPVTFEVNYGSGVDLATINLTPGHIILGGTGITGCTVTVNGTGSSRTVSVSTCSGTGTVNISIAADSAKSTTGESAPAVGPSLSFLVDNTGPSAPTGVSLGTPPTTLTRSPTITYAPANDSGGSIVANHQVKIVRALDSALIKDWTNHLSGSEVPNLTLAMNTSYAVFVRAVDGVGNNGSTSSPVTWIANGDVCLNSPTPGTVCEGGAIFLGTLSPGATSGSGTDKYMTTPGGCGEIPTTQRVGSSYPPNGDYPSADFTPVCSGADTLTKFWSDGLNSADIPALVNYSTQSGAGLSGTNLDDAYGSTNTTNIAAITDNAMGGRHAAARYCDKLVYGGYNDWYLPNRYELNLFYVNRAFIPGLDTAGMQWYWSSTEQSSYYVWMQRFSDGYQSSIPKTSSVLTRCVRRFQ